MLRVQIQDLCFKVKECASMLLIQLLYIVLVYMNKQESRPTSILFLHELTISLLSKKISIVFYKCTKLSKANE